MTKFFHWRVNNWHADRWWAKYRTWTYICKYNYGVNVEKRKNMAYNFIHIKQMENYIVNHIHIYRIILSYSIHTYEMYESAAKISQIYTESWRRFPLYAFWASFMLLRLSFSNVSWDTRLILIWKNKNIKKKKNKCGHGNSFGYFSRTLILHELSLSQTAIDWMVNTVLVQATFNTSKCCVWNFL